MLKYVFDSLRKQVGLGIGLLVNCICVLILLLLIRVGADYVTPEVLAVNKLFNPKPQVQRLSVCWLSHGAAYR
jgi:hypothetical protein